MNIWGKPVITTRIFAILFLLLSTTVGMGVTSIWNAGQFNQMINRVIVEDIPAIEAAREIETSLANQKGFATYYFLDGDPKWLNELSVHRKVFLHWLDQALLVNQEPKQRNLLEGIQKKFAVYVTEKDRVIDLYKAGDRKTGEELHWKVREQFFELKEMAATYKQVNELNIQQALETSRAKMQRLSSAAVVFMICALIFGVLLAFIMISQILMPIRRLSREAAVTGEPAPPGNEVRLLRTRVHGLMQHIDRTRSELEQSQELLMNSEKMALVGKLSTEVAHSIRNPMTSINMRLFSLKRNIDLTEVQKEDFEVVAEEMRRLDNIVSNFLEFSKPHKLKKRRIDISTVVDMTLDLLFYRLEVHSVKVVRKRSASLPLIEADPELLKEVFVNLMVNACEAIEIDGEVTITEQEAVAENIGRAVVVKFTDNGPGMSEELQKRVLEPFETTKPQGTGLGLFIAVRIVKEHGGTLELHSKEGQGTTFILTFPALEEV
ncbi:MAG: histidine kinase [Desulfobacteraceae bacterium]|nr:MAG: histidine kinase [Desulfobacteraceae bacterium]